MRWARAAIIRVTLVHITLLVLCRSTRIQPREVLARTETVDEQGYVKRPSANEMIGSDSLTKSLDSRLAETKSFVENVPSHLNGLNRYSQTANSEMSDSWHKMIKMLWLGIVPLFLFLSIWISGLQFKIVPCKSCCVKRRRRFMHKGRVIYEWEQTSSEVRLYIKLPKGIAKKKIEVKMWPRHIKIGRTGNAPFIREELYNVVDVEASSWEVTGQENDELVVSLLKASKFEWPCVFLAHSPDRKNGLEATPEESQSEQDN